MTFSFDKMKVGFIGSGQMAQAMIRSFLDSRVITADRILVSSRTDARRDKVVEKFGVIAASSNEQIVEDCDLIFLCMKPQDLVAAVEPIAMIFDDSKIVVSILAGVTIDRLQKLLSEVSKFVRVMPNTPIKVGKGVVGYTMSEESEIYEGVIKKLLSPMGLLVPVEDDDKMQAVTVGAASGTGFVLELMQYWQDWLEGYGFDPSEAKRIALHTFAGAAELGMQFPQMTLEELQSQVTSKKGTTAAGLDGMREQEIERLLRVSFEKAVLRDTELRGE